MTSNFFVSQDCVFKLAEECPFYDGQLRLVGCSMALLKLAIQICFKRLISERVAIAEPPRGPEVVLNQLMYTPIEGFDSGSE